MWSDNEADIDLLRFSYLAKAVKRLILRPYLLPTTIGLYGDWGSGKSTLLKMVQKELEETEGTVCIPFNGWLFEGYEDAKSALMGTILDALQERITADRTLLEKCQGLLSKLLKRVDWFHLVGMTGRYALPTIIGLPHLALANIGGDVAQALQAAPDVLAEKAKNLDVESAQELLKAAPEGQANIRRSIRDFRADFERLLKESGIERLVVFIDDLDRCLPDNVIETLEAIKLFLFVPGTAFIVGADERLVQYAVRQRFPELPGNEAEVGRDYLEKLIQIPVRLPALNEAEFESYLNLLFAQRDLAPADFATICASLASSAAGDVLERSFTLERARTFFDSQPQHVAVPATMQEDFDIVAQLAQILAPGLGGNPRRAKRFLNALVLRMEISEDRGLTLRRQVLAKLMLLEYLKPEFFRQLATLQAHQEGRPRELADLEHRLRVSYDEQLEAQVGGRDADGDESERNKTRDIRSAQTSSRTTPATSKGTDARASKEDDPNTGRVQRAPTKQAADESLAPAVLTWLADGWMQDWSRTDPPLAGVDLRPYFYVAHDSVGALESVRSHLSPAATDVLRLLLDSKSVSQTLGLTRAESLGPVDAAALFEAMAIRVRQAEILDAGSPYPTLVKLIQRRPELLPQLIALLDALPETKVPLSAGANLLEIARGTQSMAAVQALIQRWSHSPHTRLAQAMTALLTRPAH